MSYERYGMIGCIMWRGELGHVSLERQCLLMCVCITRRYGIIGCIISRGVFTFLGQTAMESPFEPFINLCLCALMFYLGIGMMFEEEDDEVFISLGS